MTHGSLARKPLVAERTRWLRLETEGTNRMTEDVSESTAKETALRDLRRIPGVGQSIGVDLWDLGVRRVEQLEGADPERLYERLCALRGTHIDRCMLYVLRCAVYFAGPEPHDPELLKWWAWKDAARPRG